VEEAVREMLRRTIAEGGLPFSRIADDDEIYGDNDPVYDPMFRAKVQEALDDPRPALSAEEAEQRMAQRRVSAMARVS
jgi:DNA-damage-inducible protein J